MAALALARLAGLRVNDFNTQELTDAVLDRATAGQSDAQLFIALARVAEWRMGDFEAQDLANTAWAFATASQSHAQLFAV